MIPHPLRRKRGAESSLLITTEAMVAELPKRTSGSLGAIAWVQSNHRFAIEPQSVPPAGRTTGRPASRQSQKLMPDLLRREEEVLLVG